MWVSPISHKLMNYTSRNLRYMLDVSIVSIEKSPCENLERQQYSQPLSSSGQHGKGVFLLLDQIKPNEPREEVPTQVLIFQRYDNNKDIIMIIGDGVNVSFEKTEKPKSFLTG